jgi:guanylate kinase
MGTETAAALEVHGLQDAFTRDYPRLLDGLGRVLVLGAVSGVDRSSVGEAVQAGLGDRVALIRNYTTRPRRPVDEGARLIFGDDAELQERRRAGDVLFQTRWEQV